MVLIAAVHLAAGQAPRAAAQSIDDDAVENAALAAHEGRWNDVRRLLEGAPRTPRSAALLASALENLGETEAADTVLREALVAHPQAIELWTQFVLAAEGRRDATECLRRLEQAQKRVPPTPELHLAAAKSFAALDQVLGTPEIRAYPEARAGQFVDGWLLLEERESHQFTCCPRASAMYHVRRALDAAPDNDAAHLLHAMLWTRLGRGEIGLQIVRSREPLLLRSGSPAVLEQMAQVALGADDLSAFLRYSRLRADRDLERREEILVDAYRSLAARFNDRGQPDLHADALRRAVKLRPDDPALALELADAEWSLGRRAEAARLYRRLLQEQPLHPERQRTLQRLTEFSALNEAER